MRNLTPSDYQRMIVHYKKHLKSYERMLSSVTDEELKLSLEESISACLQGIEHAQAEHDALIASETFLH